MKKNKLKEIILDSESFKKVKNKKKIIYVIPNNEDFSELKSKSKVVVINKNNDKKTKRKIKKIYQAESLEKLKNTLKKKEKYIMPRNIDELYKEEDIVKNGLLGIEFKSRKRVVRKILLVILILSICVLSYFYIDTLINDYKNDRLKNKIQDIQEEITYVVIEINPKMILEFKDEKVTKIGCLNKDCQTIFNNINIDDKSIKEAVEILYEQAKNSGIDVSKGVKVSSTNEVVQDEIKELDYTVYVEINKEEEKKYLDSVLDNNEIKEQTSKEEINNKLLETYKNDPDYGKYYTCNIEGSELACYITTEFEEILSSFGTYEETWNEIYASINNVRKFESILDKFNVKYNSGGFEGLDINLVETIYARGVEYNLTGEISYGHSVVSTDGPASSVQSSYNRIGITIYNDETEIIYTITLPLSKFNLVTSDYKDSDLVTITIDEETHTLKIS